MSRPSYGPRGSTDTQGMVLGIAAVSVVLLATLAWVPVALTRPPGYTGGHPLIVVKGLLDGTIHWNLPMIVAAVIELAVLATAVIGALALWRRWKGRRSRVDQAAASMGKAKDIAALTPAGVRESAMRLRPSLGASAKDGDEFGIPLGETVDGGVPLRQSWEDTAIHIWGTRTGKTTSQAIPTIVAAPGAVLATSVKADIVDATRGVRERRGQIWVFDTQGMYETEQQTWYWNPLDTLNTVTLARQLAGHFANAERSTDDRKDSFFDPEAEELVANLQLAAACAKRTLIDVFKWSTQPGNEDPARILARSGFELAADAIHAVIGLPDRTRGGIYGGAKKLLNFLTDPHTLRWVTPQPGLRKFEPEQFARSTDTIYLLCKGGPGSPAPLVAALTDAIWRAADSVGARMPGRRLDPPLVSDLDEVANIVRIRDLPKKYSYYGSRGMPISAILQSYAQGEDCWGAQGMRQIWDAANLRTYGGGNADPIFLGRLSELIGDHDVDVRSTTVSKDGRSVSTQIQRRRILDVAALAALPRGRMIMIASGAPAVLAKTRPWQHGPHADAIGESLRRYDPAGSFPTQLDPPLATEPGIMIDAQIGQTTPADHVRRL